MVLGSVGDSTTGCTLMSSIDRYCPALIVEANWMVLLAPSAVTTALSWMKPPVMVSLTEICWTPFQRADND